MKLTTNYPNQATSFLERYDYYFKRIKQTIFSFIIFILLGLIFLSGLTLGYFASIVSDAKSIDNHELMRQITRLPELNLAHPEKENLIAVYNQQEPPLIAGPAEVSPYVTKALVASEVQIFIHIMVFYRKRYYVQCIKIFLTLNLRQVGAPLPSNL